MSAIMDALPWRVGRLEESQIDLTKTVDGLTKNEAVSNQKQSELTDRVAELTTWVKWAIITMVAFAFTVAGSAVGVALTVGSTH